MTDFADFKTQIAEWANRQDWSDTLVTSFVRMAEQKFNQDLRIDRMLKIEQGLIASGCAPLPDDWLAMDFVQWPSIITNQTGYTPIRYKSRDEFFNLSQDQSFGYYTIKGRNIHFGGAPDTINGRVTKLTYYAEVPVFADTVPSWVYTKFPNLYLFAALMHADLHAIGEENQAAMLKGQVDDAIAKLNVAHLLSKASGSRVTRTRTRSFG
jgi:hypothetical protein